MSGYAKTANSIYVYVIHQNDPVTGRYDEDKCMVGYPNKRLAIKAYLSQYDRPGFLGAVSVFHIDDFKKELKNKRGIQLYRSPILIERGNGNG